MSTQPHEDHARAQGQTTRSRHLTAHAGGRSLPDGAESPTAGPSTGPPARLTHDRCPEEPLIGLRVLSVWLGVSESTIRKWAARGPGTGLLPTMIRVNGQLRFRP